MRTIPDPNEPGNASLSEWYGSMLEAAELLENYPSDGGDWRPDLSEQLRHVAAYLIPPETFA